MVVMVAAGVVSEGGCPICVDFQVGQKEEVLCVVTEGSVEIIEGLEEGHDEEGRVFIRSVGVSKIYTE